MPGTIRFEYDQANDVHIAYPNWFIETEDDCRAWAKQYESYFAQFERPVDVILVCDEFQVGRDVGTIWGKYRADVIRRFTRYSVRVYADAKVATYTATSGALHGAAFDEARDVATATALIHEQRRRGRAPTDPS